MHMGAVQPNGFPLRLIHLLILKANSARGRYGYQSVNVQANKIIEIDDELKKLQALANEGRSE
jgi:hypothetical protein